MAPSLLSDSAMALGKGSESRLMVSPLAQETDDAEVLHRALNQFNHTRLTPMLPQPNWREAIAQEAVMVEREGEMIERERLAVHHVASTVPLDAEGFLCWFEDLKAGGPGQGDPLFPWLATHATREQVRWFLEQEVSGEAGFEDLTALSQLKLPPRPKLEMASNYWDEMGQGHVTGMHGPMLTRLAVEMEIDTTRSEPVWEALALANCMMGMATQRRYAYQSIGALGVIELTAPGRAVYVNAALKRLGVGGEARKYFALHSTLDVKHSHAWNREVLHPLVEENPAVAVALAEGALIRLRAGARCFERYRRHFGLSFDG